MIIFTCLGIIASVFQLVILREFSFSIGKNELVFIIASGVWIISCSLGSITKKRLSESILPFPAASAVVFCLCVSVIHLFKPFLGIKYYEATGIWLNLALCIVLVGSNAFIIGRAFTGYALANSRGKQDNSNFPMFLGAEAIGFLLGGTVFTFLLSSYANPMFFPLFTLIAVPAIKERSKMILSAFIITAVTIISCASFNSIIKIEFGNPEKISIFGSGYGPIVSATRKGTTTLFSEGSMLATSEDRQGNEEFIHISLAALEPSGEKDILYIGPAVSGQLKELSKYSLSSLDCVQINPIVSRLARLGMPKEITSAARVITQDPRSYLKQTSKKYDAIIMSMPAPMSLALNRYFTQEFFALAASRLKTKGIFAFSIPSKREILSPSFASFNSSIINALNREFKSKIIVPSDSMLVVCANGKNLKSQGLIANFSTNRIKTFFLTTHHLASLLDHSIAEYAQGKINSSIAANTDLNPAGFTYYLALEQAKFHPGIRLDLETMRRGVIAFAIIAILLALSGGCFSRKMSCLINIAAAGFTSISLSAVIFMLFQVYCGALYWKTGLLISAFMAGLSAGVFLVNRNEALVKIKVAWIFLLWMAAICALYPGMKLFAGNGAAEVVYYGYALVCGFVTGGAYPILARGINKSAFQSNSPAAVIYSADLAGAFLGTLLCAGLLVPFLGITSTILALLLINAIFALKNLRR